MRVKELKELLGHDDNATVKVWTLDNDEVTFLANIDDVQVGLNIVSISLKDY